MQKRAVVNVTVYVLTRTANQIAITTTAPSSTKIIITIIVIVNLLLILETSLTVECY